MARAVSKFLFIQSNHDLSSHEREREREREREIEGVNKRGVSMMRINFMLHM